jgi:tripartite-type tricarboxylate transporter receptor subunit TctC
MSMKAGTGRAMAAALLLGLLGHAAGAAAQGGVAEFYKGKTITLFVGSEPGGGYDGDARVVARHLGRHIPGAPAIIVQNMPGARGLTSANNLYALAKQDGTIMGILEREHLIDAYLMPEGVRFDERNFSWIGSTGSEEGVAFTWHTAPHKTLEDVRKSETIVGGNSFSGLLPRIYNFTMATQFKVVTGYPGSAAVLQAVEKGEVEGIANFGLSNLLAKHADWIHDHKIALLLQTGEKRNEALPGVPSAFDFALDENKREILDLWLAPNAVARPFAMPPNVPRDRLIAVRQGFMAMFEDAAFLAEARKIGMVIEPRDGAFIDSLIARLRALPPTILAAAKLAAGN